MSIKITLSAVYNHIAYLLDTIPNGISEAFLSELPIRIVLYSPIRIDGLYRTGTEVVYEMGYVSKRRVV